MLHASLSVAAINAAEMWLPERREVGRGWASRKPLPEGIDSMVPIHASRGDRSSITWVWCRRLRMDMDRSRSITHSTIPLLHVGVLTGVVLTVARAARVRAVSYTHLRAHETPEHLVCRLLLEKKKKKI
eukprot:TRINITY_DN56267_c0_g1_i4.p1 TRINITY_DN56267_c0_g1~~TRINITY_DN56267_c0_g1_i4.p1  ORF type:complete len:129 (-),score=19.34 TRINITY_DN56267_c0_g1_i4:53-439(-)